MDNRSSSFICERVTIFYNYVFDLGRSVQPVNVARALLESEVGVAFYNPMSGDYELAEEYRPWVEFYNAAQRAKGEEDLEPEDNSPTSDYTDIEEAVEEAFDLFVTLTKLLALANHVDRTVFSEDYLNRAPFVRVSLKAFTAEIRDEVMDFDVAVTIHRTGTAILTAYGVFEKQMTPHEAVQLSRFSHVPVVGVELPSPLVERDLALFTGSSLSSEQRQELLAELSEAHPPRHPGYLNAPPDLEGSLSWILSAYSTVITEVVQDRQFRSYDEMYESIRSSGWHGFPLVFIEKTRPSYARSSEFKTEHRETLAQMVSGFDRPVPLRQEIIEQACSADLSLVEDYSLYLNEGIGFVIYFTDPQDSTNGGVDPGAERIRQKFLTSSVIDLLLMQRSILSTFTDVLAEPAQDIRTLNQLRQEYLQALQEFEAIGVSHWGTVAEIIKEGQSLLRISDKRELFLTKLESIEALIMGAKEERQKQRDFQIKILTTLVAVLFTLSAVNAVTRVLQGWSPVLSGGYPQWVDDLYDSTVGWIQRHPVRATIAMYAFALIVSLTSLWLATSTRVRRVYPVGVKHEAPTFDEKPISPVTMTFAPPEEEE